MPFLVKKARAIFSELRRRHVFRVTVVYVAVSWLLLQLGEIVFPAVGLPDLALTVLVVVVAFGFPIAVVLAWAFDLTPEGIRRTGPAEEESTGSPRLVSDGGEAPATPADGSTQAQPVPDPPVAYPKETIAVLPFANLSDELENQYFADGITEDITTQLSKIRSLKVVSRTSAMKFRPGEHSVTEIAGELRVGSVLEGSVRRSGSRVRIVAQFIDAASDQHLWAETFDRDLHDIFAIQSEVSHHIAEALRAELSPEEEARLDSVPTDNLDAYHLYHKGRFHWNLRTEASLTESLVHFEGALEKDPDYALVHAGKAEAWAALGLYNARSPDEAMPSAKAAAERAIALDPGLGEPYAALGCVLGVHDWDWPRGEEAFRQAMALSPGYATGFQWYALQNLAPQGRFTEAREVLAKALELDPLSAVIRASLGFITYLEGDNEGAAASLEELIGREPSFAMAYYFLGEAFLKMGDASSAIRAQRKASELRGQSPEGLAAVGIALAQAGESAEARAVLAELEAARTKKFVSPTRFAQLHIALGDAEAAFQELDRSLQLRTTDLMWIGVHPDFDPIRADPRFAELKSTVGLL